MKRIIYLLLGICLAANLPAQMPEGLPGVNSIQQKIAVQRATGAEFPTVRLFEAGPEKRTAEPYGPYMALRLDAESLGDVYTADLQSLTLEFPTPNGETLEVELFQVNLLEPDTRLRYVDKDGEHSFTPEPNRYYRGAIKGQRSVAALTITRYAVYGMFAGESGNYNLGAVKGSLTEYVLYNDAELRFPQEFICSAEDQPLQLPGDVSSADLYTTRCVRLHVDADFDLFQQQGANIGNTYNYVVSLFNEVGAVYDVENITLGLYGVTIWTFNDPFPPNFDPSAGFVNASSGVALNNFANVIQNSFPGVISCLLAADAGGLGGLAWINQLCGTYNTGNDGPWGPYLYCDVGGGNPATPFPTYSWDVMVWAHELGHSLGSNHTHWCGWQGGAIDNCAAPEGNCTPGPAPPTAGGTIMSYCHLSSTINLASGFGPQPGNLIRQNIEQAPCLAACFGVCADALSVTENIGSTGNENLYFEANSSIESFGVVFSGSQTVFDAGNRVLMRPGFHAVAGSVVRAFINGCGPGLEPPEVEDRTEAEVRAEAPALVLNTLSIAPNPFSSTSTISYSLTEPQQVGLKVYNSVGGLMVALVDQEHQPAGDYQYEVGKAGLPDGVYFLVVERDKEREVRQFVKVSR